MSAFNTQTLGKYPEDNQSLQQHGESLKTGNKRCFTKVDAQTQTCVDLALQLGPSVFILKIVVKICETVERTFILCGPFASAIIEMTCHWRNWILLLLLGLSKHVQTKLPWKYQGEGLCKLLLIWEWTLSQVLMVGLTDVGMDTTPEPSEVKEVIQEQQMTAIIDCCRKLKNLSALMKLACFSVYNLVKVLLLWRLLPWLNSKCPFQAMLMEMINCHILVIVHVAFNNVTASSHKIWWPIQLPG
jgi:hypothetical protein